MATIIITGLLQDSERNGEAMSQLRGGTSFVSRLTLGEPIRVFIPASRSGRLSRAIRSARWRRSTRSDYGRQHGYHFFLTDQRQVGFTLLGWFQPSHT
ncbi:MAG: hypothetical protein JWR22_1821 [Herminiimonas sp.]|nr:hypothetical protein [Herminiimonas sp.]